MGNRNRISKCAVIRKDAVSGARCRIHTVIDDGVSTKVPVAKATDSKTLRKGSGVRAGGSIGKGAVFATRVVLLPCPHVGAIATAAVVTTEAAAGTTVFGMLPRVRS